MRAVWKGYLKCGLVTIPVKMYNAVKKKTLQFSLLHKNLPQGTVGFQPTGECGRRSAPSSSNDKIERMCYD